MAAWPLLGGSVTDVEAETGYSWRQLAEQWLLILLGVGIALFVLIGLGGLAQALVLLAAGLLVAITGLHLFPTQRHS